MNIKKPEEKIKKVKSAVGRWKEFAEEGKVDPVLRDSIAARLLA